MKGRGGGQWPGVQWVGLCWRISSKVEQIWYIVHIQVLKHRTKVLNLFFFKWHIFWTFKKCKKCRFVIFQNNIFCVVVHWDPYQKIKQNNFWGKKATFRAFKNVCFSSKIGKMTGLGIRSFDFRANRSFFCPKMSE